MGTIKIGSASNKKGITIDPKIVLFNGNNVKKIMSGATEIWNNIRALVPIMTSNTAENGQAFINNVYSNSQAYYAFDGLETSGATVNFAGGIGYNFTTPVLIRRVYLHMAYHASKDPTYTPAKIIIQASNDGSTWNDLYTFDNAAKEEIIDVSFNNENYYQYYRCYFPNGNGGSYTSVKIIQFYGTQL